MPQRRNKVNHSVRPSYIILNIPREPKKQGVRILSFDFKKNRNNSIFCKTKKVKYKPGSLRIAGITE